MRKYYIELSQQMRIEMNKMSDQIGHAGEKGRHNELVLTKFLQDYLPKKYALSTGFVVSADGERSRQTDIIIHDRIHSPAFIQGDACRLVPIETITEISSRVIVNKASMKIKHEVIKSILKKLAQVAAKL